MTRTRLLLAPALTIVVLVACGRTGSTPSPAIPAGTPTFPLIAPPLPSATPEGLLPPPTTAFAPLQTPVPLQTIIAALPEKPLSTVSGRPITNLAVAPDGTVWFSDGDYGAYPLGDGVYRYDGRELTRFPDVIGDADGLGVNVQTLRVAPDGMVWAGARGNVARFNGQTWQAVSIDCQCPSGLVSDFAFTPDGSVWIATMHNLFRFDGQALSAFGRLANRLAVASDGSLWVSGWEGRQDSGYLARFDGANWTTYYTADYFQGSAGQIVPGPDRLLWSVGSRCLEGGGCAVESLVTFDGRSWTQSPDAVNSPRGVDGAAVASDGALWFVSDIGLVRFDGREWLADQNALAASAVAVASDGRLWVGTQAGQVFHYGPRFVSISD